MIWSKWYRRMRQQGLRWTLHDFRRSAYVNLVNAGVDPLTAARLIGHKGLPTASRYIVNAGIGDALDVALDKRDAYLADRLAATGGAQSDQNPTIASLRVG